MATASAPAMSRNAAPLAHRIAAVVLSPLLSVVVLCVVFLGRGTRALVGLISNGDGGG